MKIPLKSSRQIPFPELLFGMLLGILTVTSTQAQRYSSLVYPAEDGKLRYAGYANVGQSNASNEVLDFSHAGYKGGGVPIPWVPVVLELSPTLDTSDDYPRIQSAIDTVAAMPLSEDGFRGAILLKKGTYHVSSRLVINADGIVLRGEGQGDSGGTIITLTSTKAETCIQVLGGSSKFSSAVPGTTSPITASFVPSGSRTIPVLDASHFSVGDSIVVERTPNQTWIDLIDMAQWGWTPEFYHTFQPFVITGISGNVITIDCPLTHSIESVHGGGEVYLNSWQPVRNSGVERMRLRSIFNGPEDEDHGRDAVRLTQTENCWVRQVTARHFSYSCANVTGSINATIEDCAMLDPVSQIIGGRRYSYNLGSSSRIVFQRCYAQYGRHDFVLASRTMGPSAFVDCLAEDAYADTGPHNRYSVGTLFDNVKVTGNSINVRNRRGSGTGHGWVGAQMMLWNCNASKIRCDAPNAAMNFSIGSVALKTTDDRDSIGHWESEQIPVTPRSLYYKQLEDRLGTPAVLATTAPAQRENNIWNELASWRGDANTPPWAPPFTPLAAVEAYAGREAQSGVAHQLTAVLTHPLPDSFTTDAGWTLVNGPGSVEFSDPSAVVTTATFTVPGTYVFEYSINQVDDTNPQNTIGYSASDRVAVSIPIGSSLLKPQNFKPLGNIEDNSVTLTFDTDTLEVSGVGFSEFGQLVRNSDGSLAAAFAFEDINLVQQPRVVGTRPFLLLSRGDLRLDTSITGSGGDGNHGRHGVGRLGGGDGGDGFRNDLTPSNPFDAQGAGGTLGDSLASEDRTSGGGGFGGAGGQGYGNRSNGGSSYGDSKLTSLIGGSGAGGTRNKGGGAGGGAIGLVANGSLEMTGKAVLDVRGGDGSSSGSQSTSGGGSGGAILLRGNKVVLAGTFNAGGGNGGNASGGQPRGGGGGGGRIVIFYETTISSLGYDIQLAGGVPVGNGPGGRPGDFGDFNLFQHTNPLTIESLTPATNGNKVILVADLMATFSEPIQAGSGYIELRRSADDGLVERFDVVDSPRLSISGRELTIDPTSDFEKSTDYYLRMDSGATVESKGSDSFAGIDDKSIWTFTTRAGNLYIEWIANYETFGQAELEHDADGDIIPNGLENILGTDPTRADPSAIRSIERSDSRTVILTHLFNSQPACDLKLHYLWSLDLEHFHDSGQSDEQTSVVITPQSDSPSPGMMTATATISGEIPKRLFITLEARPE